MTWATQLQPRSCLDEQRRGQPPTLEDPVAVRVEPLLHHLPLVDCDQLAPSGLTPLGSAETETSERGRSGLASDERDELFLRAGVGTCLDGRAEHVGPPQHLFWQALEAHQGGLDRFGGKRVVNAQ